MDSKAAADPTAGNDGNPPDTTSLKSMYELEWVKKLLRQITDLVQDSTDWLGIDNSKPQRILDYACGNGTISAALIDKFPQATFHGVDILDTQVALFNEEAVRILGEKACDRMHAIKGDLNEPDKYPELSRPEWFGFDSVIVSYALHHFDDPISFLNLLKNRVKPGGTVVVVDYLKEDGETVAGKPKAQRAPGEPKYKVEDMFPVPMGRLWPGFTMDDIREDYEAAGCTDVDIKTWPDRVELPKLPTSDGKVTMYISKATSPPESE